MNEGQPCTQLNDLVFTHLKTLIDQIKMTLTHLNTGQVHSRIIFYMIWIHNFWTFMWHQSQARGRPLGQGSKWKSNIKTQMQAVTSLLHRCWRRILPISYWRPVVLVTRLKSSRLIFNISDWFVYWSSRQDNDSTTNVWKLSP